MQLPKGTRYEIFVEKRGFSDFIERNPHLIDAFRITNQDGKHLERKVIFSTDNIDELLCWCSHYEIRPQRKRRGVHGVSIRDAEVLSKDKFSFTIVPYWYSYLT